MTQTSEQRIQKIIAQSGLCSRREAERLIDAGEVRVNGKVATLGLKALPGTPIFVKNKPLMAQASESLTLLMHKPKGVLCTNGDPHGGKTVFDLLPKSLLNTRLYCAGRLDKDSEGLLIITNDGELAHSITHPSTQIVKRYRVRLNKDFNPADKAKLLEGTHFEGDFLKAEKVILAPEEGEDHRKRLEIHLHHGKKREIRRLLEAHRYFVKKLVRIQIGGLVLKNLPKGGIRILSKAEVERLRTS
jgi:23S rRNA pseudouridine2605 synthase